MLSFKKKTIDRRFKKGSKLNYRSVRYKNPFFQKRKKQTIRIKTLNLPFKIKLILLGCLLALLFLFYAFFYSSYFTIKKINIKGQGRIDPDIIKNLAKSQVDNNFLIFLPQKNIFLFSANKLKETLNNKYSFDFLSIDKKLPNTLYINFEEKEYAFIWEENEKYFYTDEFGAIINEANPLEIKQKDYPLIKNESNDKIFEQQVSVRQEYLFAAQKISTIIRDKKLDLVIERFIIDMEFNTLKLKLLSGPEIYFKIDSDIESQVDKLIILKIEKLSNDFNSRTYIDVRYGDSIYYR